MNTLLLAPFLILFFIIPHAQAEIFSIDGKNKEISIFIAIEDNSSIIKLDDSKIGYSEHWDSKIKFYNSGGFSIKNPESGIAVYGHPISKSQYDLTILTSENVQRLTASTNQTNEIKDDDNTTKRIEPKSSLGSDITKWNIPTNPRNQDRESNVTVTFHDIDSVFLNRDYAPLVNVKDEWHKGIEANISLEVVRNDKVLISESDTTTPNGFWSPVLYISYPKFMIGFCYDVTITAAVGNNTDTITHDFLVTTTSKYWKQGGENVIEIEPTRSDSKCNE